MATLRIVVRSEGKGFLVPFVVAIGADQGHAEAPGQGGPPLVEAVLAVASARREAFRKIPNPATRGVGLASGIRNGTARRPAPHRSAGPDPTRQKSRCGWEYKPAAPQTPKQFLSVRMFEARLLSPRPGRNSSLRWLRSGNCPDKPAAKAQRMAM